MSVATVQKIQALEMKGIVKRFPGVLANDRVSIDVRAGEIHALLGENGAGKSTLMKILYGMYAPDEGQISINGQVVQIKSPADAIHQGIGMIHQHFMLVPSLTVTENVALGLPSTRGALLDLDRVAARIEELSKAYGLQVNPQAAVWQLSVGEQQRVEIIKALYRDAALLVLDEPTAVLTPQEVDELFVILRQMCDRGHALIFITHKLHEVIRVSDRVTVLRDGQVIRTLPTKGSTREELARLMIGRDVMRVDRPAVQAGAVRLRLDNVRAKSDQAGVMALQGVSLELRAGEILGVAGVSGNGQRELAECITGLRKASQGQIELDGENITSSTPQMLLARGLAYVPEERMRDGAIKEFTVAENFILRDHDDHQYSDGMFLNFGRIADRVREMIRAFDVKTPSHETPLKNLSGGNIQKLILARELSRKPRVLIAAQPTRGVDIGATEYIHQLLIKQRSEGLATLLISEDLDEILTLADRIAVMYEGRIIGVVDREDATAQGLGLMMAGVTPTA